MYTIENEFTLKNPSKNGYSFAGWTGTDLTGATMTVTVTRGHIGARAYTATWTAQTYTLIYQANGGDAKAQMNYQPTDTKQLGDTTRVGHEFRAWNVLSTAGSWTANEEYASGRSDDLVVTAGEYAYNANVTVAAASVLRTNYPRYTFTTWKRVGANNVEYRPGSSFNLSTLGLTYTDNVTMTAQWSIESYTIVYDTRGGSAVNSESYNITSSFVLPSSTRTGYTFATWKPASDVGGWLTTESYDAGSMVVDQWGNVTLNAIWTPDVYLIVYDLAGGALENGASNPDEYTIETTTFTLENPTREGYAFVGWTGSDLSEASQTVTIRKGSMGGRQFTAVWESSAHTHTYSAVVTPPTCTEIGFTTYTCTGCGHSYDSDFVPALDHDWTKWVTIVQPTTTESGLEKRTCSRCGETETRTIDPVTAVFAVSGATARPGETITVTVSVENNPGIIAAMLHIGYDPQILTLIGVENGRLFGTGTFFPGRDLAEIPYTLLWEDSLAQTNHTEDGVLATLRFKVLAYAPQGETTITLSYSKESTINAELEELNFALMNGTVSMVNRIAGDANGDGFVNMKDVVVLRRFLSGGWDVTINPLNADVNADAAVDLKDVVIMRRWFSGGWGVVLL